MKERRRTDMAWRISETLRSKMHKFLRGEKTSFQEYLGLDYDTFLEWLEFQFEPGMTWDSYGSEWQIDHVLPSASFDFRHEHDKRICHQWTNLQPLWARENRAKTDRIEHHHFFNSFVSAHRFITSRGLDRLEYQRLRESLAWLRAKISGTVTSSWMKVSRPEMDNPQPSS